MRLSVKIIKNYCNNNMFAYADNWIVRANEPNTLYFQIVDLDQDGLRYMPINTPIVVSAIFPSIDDDQSVTAVASLADAADNSIWKVVLSSSQVPQSGNIQFQVSENGIIRRFNILNGISVEYPQNDGSC